MKLALGLMGLAAFIAATSDARAADLPRQQEVYRAPAVVPVQGYNWSGFYLGVMGGYAKGAGDYDDLKGGFAGGTIGWNYQPVGSSFVFGVEADGAWSDFGASLTVVGPGVTATASSEMHAIATLRARLGAAFDRTLVYVTGGGAWARNEIAVSVAVPGLAIGASDTQNHFGYSVGGGIEQAFGGGWSAKAEYLYLGLKSENYFTTVLGGVPSGDVDIHTGKVGLNYRF